MPEGIHALDEAGQAAYRKRMGIMDEPKPTTVERAAQSAKRAASDAHTEAEEKQKEKRGAPTGRKGPQY